MWLPLMSFSQAQITANRQRGPYDLGVETVSRSVPMQCGKQWPENRRVGPIQQKGRRAVDISDLVQRHALLGQFPFCFLVLAQVHQAHATQHIRRFGELNIVVTDDLYSVAPGVPKIKERTIQ
jgi:hypothetical protein